MNTYFRTGVVTLLLGFSLTACHEAKKSDTSAESTASERKLDFQSDDEFLTYIQKAHFNYMWEGAEPTSGLACERIHTDGVYPENDADIVTTDVWTSMGFEAENEARLRDFADYQVDGDMMRVADKEAVFMHCLPAHRGEEVTAEVIDGPQSVVWDEAENRLHAQKALLEFLVVGRIEN